MKPITKETRNKLINAAFIIGTFLFVLLSAVQSGDFSNLGKAFLDLNLKWLLVAVLCFIVQTFFEGAILHVFFVFQKVKARLSTSILTGLIGMYYSAITPAATGGQPMQVFALKKRGIPPGVSSSALAVKFFGWQCALLIIGSILWILKPALVSQTLDKGIALVIIGYFVNGLMVVLVVLLAISRNLVRALIIFFVNLFYRLRIVKDKDKTSSHWDAALNDFHASVDILTKHPFQFLVLFCMSVIQVTSLMSATYFVYRAFGLNAASYLDILTIQIMLFIAASFTPLPGASGAQEGGFYLFFGKFFPSSMLYPALFVWRFITYYLSIICGFSAVILDQARFIKRKAQKNDKKMKEPQAPETEEKP